MKPLFIILLLLLSITAFPQQVLLKGKVTDTLGRAGKFSPFRIIVNDTVNKLIQHHAEILKALKTKQKHPQLRELELAVQRNQEQLTQLQDNPDYVLRPDEDGSFQIKADRKDTLYFRSYNFITQKHAVKDLLKMKRIDVRLQPEPCVTRTGCDEKDPKLYVFIAEKISVKEVPNPHYCDGSFPMDSRFAAQYKVIKNMHGAYQQDTVNFTAFDHYGTPRFVDYQYVMLFVSERCGNIYHQKYQFFDVYPTADGRWARPGDPFRFDQDQEQDVKAIPITFKDSLSFDISYEYQHVFETEYPAPYFKIENDKAYPLTGAYAETLFEIKKKGVLKARGFDIK